MRNRMLNHKKMKIGLVLLLCLTTVLAGSCRRLVFRAVGMVKAGEYAPVVSEITKACVQDSWLGNLYSQDRKAYKVMI